MSFRIRAARAERPRRALRDGQADRRRLHQPARRPRHARSPSWPAPTQAFERAERQRRATTVRLRPRRCRRPAQIRGTCQMFGTVGLDRPFYSYRICDADPDRARSWARPSATRCSHLTTDLEGSSEVGGLFLHPERARPGGLGRAARAQPLSVHPHATASASPTRMLAELRGVIDEAGDSPFWDAIAGRFFGMTFPEADEFNAVHGTQFIADLMPKTPIYTAMLPDERARGDRPAAPIGPGGDADARGRGLRVRQLCRHFRRRADDGRGDRRDPHGARMPETRRSSSRDQAAGRKAMLVARGRLEDFAACCGDGRGGRRRRAIASMPRRAALLGVGAGRHDPRRGALMAIREINFDGIVGPSHNYAGLSLGNLAATRNAGEISLSRAPRRCRASAKMRAQPRAWAGAGDVRAARRGPNRDWLAALGTSDRGVPTHARAAAHVAPRRCGRPMPRPSRPRPTPTTASAT